MDLIETVEDLHRADAPGEGTRCVLVPALDAELAGAAAEALVLHLHPSRPAPRRPRAVVDGDQVDMVMFALGEEGHQHRLEVIAGPGGVLIAAEEAAAPVVRETLGRAAPESTSAQVVVLLALAVARRCEDVLDTIDDRCQELEARATGYTSAAQRRTMSRLRALLFHLQEAQAAQQAMLAADEELAQHLDHRTRRLLQRAGTAFDANRSMAARLYAMLGDLLQEQDTVVSERLTLVATIFLPLTLATGFFGMNFAWMTDRIGSFGTFVLFGVALPAVLTAITLYCIHRLTRSS